MEAAKEAVLTQLTDLNREVAYTNARMDELQNRIEGQDDQARRQRLEKRMREYEVEKERLNVRRVILGRCLMPVTHALAVSSRMIVCMCRGNLAVHQK